MKKWIVFVLLSALALGMWGCFKKDLVVFGYAMLCPDCGGYHNEDAEVCPICERNEKLKEWLESNRLDKNNSTLRSITD